MHKRFKREQHSHNKECCQRVNELRVELSTCRDGNIKNDSNIRKAVEARSTSLVAKCILHHKTALPSAALLLSLPRHHILHDSWGKNKRRVQKMYNKKINT
ncbi:hypothetical protein DQ04_15671000 [Trypanosoma grayi]|uniref:hypothetical protein n=1 Tax=Trypanosoma grayi TaxID=71804 RepID=UPI0004F3F3B6|nr:hypothetical protein DQ04_15671000 [Trypanosoma grayi]KEG06145.1 hypothetical protein DQ04_15671000 [Trypanosoma grayi]